MDIIYVFGARYTMGEKVDRSYSSIQTRNLMLDEETFAEAFGREYECVTPREAGVEARGGATAAREWGREW